MHCRIGNVGKPPVNSGKGLNLGGKIMNNKIKVLIGSDTADCGMAWAGALKGAGMYAITRHCDGNAVLSSIKS